MHKIDTRFRLSSLAIAIAVCVSLAIRAETPLAHYIAKPIIMANVLLFALEHLGTQRNRYVVGFFVAILFSLAGDVLLMLPGDYFVGGLAAFLIAHIGYIVAFTFKHPQFAEEPLLQRKPRVIWAFFAYYVAMISALWGALGALRIPVMVYAAVITLMAIIALNRWKRVPERSFSYVFAGALLFVISDSLIAIHKFMLPELPLASFWIMLTYMAAQYLIAQGYVWALKSEG